MYEDYLTDAQLQVLWDECPEAFAAPRLRDEADELRERIRELEEENARLRDLINKHWD